MSVLPHQQTQAAVKGKLCKGMQASQLCSERPARARLLPRGRQKGQHSWLCMAQQPSMPPDMCLGRGRQGGAYTKLNPAKRLARAQLPFGRTQHDPLNDTPQQRLSARPLHAICHGLPLLTPVLPGQIKRPGVKGSRSPRQSVCPPAPARPARRTRHLRPEPLQFLVSRFHGPDSGQHEHQRKGQG